MSENAEGVKGWNGGGGAGGEEISVDEALAESSKKAFNNQSSNVVNIDDELLSWLHYPLDDALFQHWPPAPLPSLAPPPSSADFFSSSSSSSSSLSTFLSSSSSSSSSSHSSSPSSSSFAVKHLPHLDHEAFMVAKELDRRASFDDWFLHREDTGSELLRREQSTSALRNKGAVIGEEHNLWVKDHNEGYVWEHRGGETRAGLWTNRVLNCKQGVAKDSRKLAPLKLTLDEVREGMAVAAGGSPHFTSDETIWVSRDQHGDTNMMSTTHLPQNEEGQGLQREAKAEEENVVRFAQVRNEECWLKKDIDGDEHADSDMKFTAHLPQNEGGIGLQSNAKAQEENAISRLAQVSNAQCWLKKDIDMKFKEKEGTPTTVRVREHSNADAALALGADRAAGIIKPLSLEAFAKVRTSLQPTQQLPLGSPSSSSFPLSRTLSGQKLYSFNWMPTASKPLGSSANMAASQPSHEVKLPTFSQLHVSKPSASFSNKSFQENQFDMKEKGNNIKSTAKTPTLETLPMKDVENPIEGTQNVSIPEVSMAGGSGGSSAVVASESDTTNIPKHSGVSYERRMASTYSGGSQTSESLRETASGTKRKLEDSECQSEEAEGDSVVSSEARTCTSKRPRASEVHNLSERRRRNRINDKMNALRELIPNASKSNKAALLDEAIDYLKNLQLQLQVMSLRSGVSMLPMALPPSMPHMQTPQYSSLCATGMDVSGGSALAGACSTMGIGMHNTYAVPARPFSNIGSVSAPSSADLRPSQTFTVTNSFSQFQALNTVPGQSHHPQVQASSQIIAPATNNNASREQQQQQQQQQQRAQKHNYGNKNLHNIC